MLGALIENLQPIPTAVTKEQDLVKATVAELREKSPARAAGCYWY